MNEAPRNSTARPSPDLGFLDPLVGWIKAKRLQAPAALVLDMHRPLMPMAFPAAMMAGTFIAPLFGPDYYEKIEALRDPAAVDWLLMRLSDEERSGSSSHAGKTREKGARA
jgi:hypothetical protein